MKASRLLKEIRENLKDYPINYLKNKITDTRYKDPLTKSLAKYNSNIYDEIYETELVKDFKINDGVVQKIKGDINFYFDKYAPNDIETKEFTKYISLYLALIAKKPLHPYGNNPKEDEVYFKNNCYYCKGRVKFIKDNRSLCKYCICKNHPFAFSF